MMMQQRRDQLRTYAPVKTLFDNMDVLISFTNDRARWKTQSCKPVRLTQVWGSVKHVYKVHVLAHVLYTHASHCPILVSTWQACNSEVFSELGRLWLRLEHPCCQTNVLRGLMSSTDLTFVALSFVGDVPPYQSCIFLTMSNGEGARSNPCKKNAGFFGIKFT